MRKGYALAPLLMLFIRYHHHMKSLRIAALMILALIGAQNAHSTITSSFEPENDQLKSALIGVWGASNDGGRSFWGYDEFLSDGTVVSTGVPPETGVPFRAVGKMQVKGKIACTRVVETSDPQGFPVGLNVCVEVLYIDSRIQRYRYLNGGEEITIYKTTKPKK